MKWFQIQSNIEYEIDATVSITIQTNRIGIITKNRLIKAIENRYNPFGWSSKVTRLLDKMYISPIIRDNVHEAYMRMNTTEQKTFRALCAVNGLEARVQETPYSYVTNKTITFAPLNESAFTSRQKQYNSAAKMRMKLFELAPPKTLPPNDELHLEYCLRQLMNSDNIQIERTL